MKRVHQFVFAVCFGILYRSAGELPRFMNCSYQMYFCKSKVCEGIFYKSLRVKDPTPDCGKKYEELLKCYKRFLLKDCYREQSLTNSEELDDILAKQMSEDAYCNASLLTATPRRPWGTVPCSDVFYNKVSSCVDQFRAKFLTNKADPSLCREYAATKKCFQSLMDSECRFSETQTQIMKYETSDINPFCENMRDPGSSGSELCAGYFSSIASTSFEYYASAHWLPTLVISFTLNNMLM